MGRQPGDFIPVKYSNQTDKTSGQIFLNVAIGGLFLMLIYSIYKNRGAGQGPLGKGTKTGTGVNKDQKGGWFGKG